MTANFTVTCVDIPIVGAGIVTGEDYTIEWECQM